MTPELLGPREVARALGISRTEFYKWDGAGLIPAPVTVGKVRKWRRAELLAWIDSGCPARAEWRYEPGLIVKVADLHRLRCEQLAALNQEVRELEERLARGEKYTHVSGR